MSYSDQLLEECREQNVALTADLAEARRLIGEFSETVWSGGGVEIQCEGLSKEYGEKRARTANALLAYAAKHAAEG